MLSDCKVINGDCLAVLPTLKEASISLILTSPPYCMGKSYEKSDRLEDFRSNHQKILPLLPRLLTNKGSVCWQTGYHVTEGIVHPLDFEVHAIVSQYTDLILRNRIIWSYEWGLNCQKRFSGRHETILWYTKAPEYTYNLDDVRIRQKYPGKLGYKGARKGLPTSHPLGKNPGDVWSIPNVKANHIEKTPHPCQFPIELARRLIRALTNKGDTVLDPFAGSGTVGAACALEGRGFLGIEIIDEYVTLANERIHSAKMGTLRVRDDRPIYEPREGSKLTIQP